MQLQHARKDSGWKWLIKLNWQTVPKYDLTYQCSLITYSSQYDTSPYWMYSSGPLSSWNGYGFSTRTINKKIQTNVCKISFTVRNKNNRLEKHLKSTMNASFPRDAHEIWIEQRDLRGFQRFHKKTKGSRQAHMGFLGSDLPFEQTYTQNYCNKTRFQKYGILWCLYG